jgi:predicted flap endonuclease-1-like 5' DNA nuclease
MPSSGLKGTLRFRPHHMSFLLLVIVAALAALAGYVVGSRKSSAPSPPSVAPAPPAAALAIVDERSGDEGFGAEKFRIIRSLESETVLLREAIAARDAPLEQAAEFARDRERSFGELADARTETARYRQIVIDIENNAPPPILAGVGEPDDLKLIVGVGPVLERMLHNLGVTTFRQIARWSERDVAEFDAKLPEFPGRIQRDQWVTQARALHESKYGQGVPGIRARG